jgi:L-ascorbate metabolism protein UlaG (beta-lactamase superfamily)
MDITWLGHSAFKVKGKSVVIATDPYDPEALGIKLPKIEADIVTISHDHGDHNYLQGVTGHSFVANGPGEYEIKGVSFVGTASWHDSKQGSERGKNTIYTFNIDGVRLCHLGDLGQEVLTEAQIDEIGGVDILMVPVGGVFTIDAATAAKVVAQLEPKIVIPMHYKDSDIKFDLEPVENFLKEMSKEHVDPQSKFSVSADKLPEELDLVVLQKFDK